MNLKNLTKNALIIDDTKNIRLMLSKCLELEGYKVETADNGKSGLEEALKNKFDLIFLDIKLPEISGTEVLRKLRGQNIMTPVIIITAYPTVKNAVDCTQLGAIAYLQKPFTTERIHNVLCELHLESSNNNTDIDFSYINNLIERGETDKAISRLKTALSSSPEESRIYNMLGEAYHSAGNSILAEKFFKAAEAFK